MKRMHNERSPHAAPSWILAGLAACLLTGCVTAPGGKSATGEPVDPEIAKQTARENARNSREAWKSKTFEEFLRSTYREPGGKFIVNGDTPIVNEKLLREFFESTIQAEPRSDEPRGLIVNTVGGEPSIWTEQQRRNLSYCVSKTFGTRHAQVLAAMSEAGNAWSKVADVRFVHIPSLDDNCTQSTSGVVFDVRPVNVNGQYLARAFFPNESRSQRNVLIDNSAFGLAPGEKLSLIGILRHELGHTLGFRHEHTRPEAGTCFEDSNWKPVTAYDAFSVMHYPQCNGRGDWTLDLTLADKNGAACLYGAAPGFVIDANLCTDPPEPPVETGCAPDVKHFPNQTVGKGEAKNYGPFTVSGGGKLEVKMVGNGDPDLYVAFNAAPTTSKFTCRPYTDGADETCTLDVPLNTTQAFVMVRGYAASSYELTVTFTP